MILRFGGGHARIALLMAVLATGARFCAPAQAAGDTRWRLEPQSGLFEIGLASATSGRSWAADFDQGWRRSSGLEIGVESGLRLRRGPWEARARWRGRWGEFLPARGRWLEGSVRWSGNHLGLRLGREPIDWGPVPQASLLLSHHPPPLDHAGVVACFGAGPAGRGMGETFVAYLDDRHRTIPFPLLWGMRLAWEPRVWLRVEAQRTILLGGVGRTRRLQAEDIWDMFLGRRENLAGPSGHPEAYPVGDSDQKFAWQVVLHPRVWAQRRGLHDLEAFWVYAGEDHFRGLGPTAPGRALGLRVHPSPRWATSFIHAATVDDRNFWYHHKIYGYGYTYRGFLIGHPMGGDARLWHGALHWLPEPDRYWSLAIWRERRGYYRDGRGLVAGGYWGWRLGIEVPMQAIRLRAELGGSAAWGGDRTTERVPEGLFQIKLMGGGGTGSVGLDRAEVWGGPA